MKYTPEAQPAAIRTIKCHSRGVDSLELPPDGRRLASVYTAGMDTKVKLWDTLSGKLCGTYDLYFYKAFSPNSEMFALASDFETVRLYDTATGKELYKLERKVPNRDRDRRDAISALVFSSNSDMFAWAFSCGTLMLWDSTAKSSLHEIECEDHYPRTIAFSPDGSKVVSPGGVGGVEV